jgi:hypothetical protein
MGNSAVMMALDVTARQGIGRVLAGVANTSGVSARSSSLHEGRCSRGNAAAPRLGGDERERSWWSQRLTGVAVAAQGHVLAQVSRFGAEEERDMVTISLQLRSGYFYAPLCLAGDGQRPR